jgi:hypothetical protein
MGCECADARGEHTIFLDISTQPSSLPGKGFIPKCC